MRRLRRPQTRLAVLIGQASQMGTSGGVCWARRGYIGNRLNGIRAVPNRMELANRCPAAWEDDSKLETKDIAFPAPRSGDGEYRVFTLCFAHALTEHKRSTPSSKLALPTFFSPPPSIVCADRSGERRVG